MKLFSHFKEPPRVSKHFLKIPQKKGKKGKEKKSRILRRNKSSAIQQNFHEFQRILKEFLVVVRVRNDL